uniref:Methyltransferase type 11 n=1 Tax=uncultured bacterium ws198A12 TaxID=1131830 RepID=I1X5I8_9BACT|nr:methyltransferase type 11 [uncultured bacterium ws198A12]
MHEQTPWQLKMFRKGLKKNLRLKSLKRYLIDIGDDERCLLATCGDNNGAMNYFLRELGGKWSWADLEDTCIAEMSELLGDPVHFAGDEQLPFENDYFDRVIAIDVHEHVDNPNNITRELRRVTRPGGQVIVTVPNGDETKLAVRIKHALKMTKEAYGHTRVGFTVSQLQELMANNRITSLDIDTYSRFFTEMLELSINFLYVKVLKKGEREDEAEHAEIAPATSEQLKNVGGSYRLYSLIFPIYWVLSRLDYLLPFTEGYCVLIAGRRDT